jgi:hypothetical protein
MQVARRKKEFKVLSNGQEQNLGKSRQAALVSYLRGMWEQHQHCVGPLETKLHNQIQDSRITCGRMAYFIPKEWGNHQVGEFLYYEIGSDLMSGRSNNYGLIRDLVVRPVFRRSRVRYE